MGCFIVQANCYLVGDVLLNKNVIADGDTNGASMGITSIKQETGDIGKHPAQCYHHSLNIICI